MNKEFLYMQKLAGVITEGEYKEKLQTVREAEGLIDISAGPAAVLAAAAKIPQAVLQAGDTDGNPNDEKVTIEKGSARAGSLQPTQSEIGTGQSLDDQMTNKYNALDLALAGKNLGPNGGAPILTFGGKYVLDGHHRWSQFKATNPDASVEIADIKAPGVKNEKAALGLVHAILFALYGKSPTKPFQGENLFSLGKEGIKKYIMGKEVTPEVLNKLVKAGKIEKPEKELAAEYWVNNLSDIKQGAFPRTVMPQTVDAGDTYIAKGNTPPDAASGKVNYINPKQSDVKKDLQETKHWQKLAGIITEGEYKENIMKRKITKKQLQELIKEEVIALNEKEETVKAKVEDEAAKKIESDPSARKEAEKSLPELAKKLNLSIEDLADSKKVEMALMKSGVADEINEAVGHTDWDHSSEYGDSSLKPYWRKKARADREAEADRRKRERKRSRNSSDYNKATGMKRIGAILGIGGLTTSIGGLALGALGVISPVAGLAALIAGAATGLIGGSKYRKGDDIQSKLRMGESTDNKNIKITKRELREMIRELLEEGLL